MFFAALSIIGTVTKDRRDVQKRIEVVKGKQKSLFEGFENKRANKRRLLEDRAKNLSPKQKKFMQVVFNELVLADIMMRPEEFCTIWFVLATVPAGLAALFGAGAIPSITLACMGASIPIIFIKVKKKQRIKAFEVQLSDSLMIVCNCLRSGLSFQQGLETISRDMPAPIGVEFGRCVNEVRYGATLEEALNNMSNRVKSADLMLAVSAVNIQRQTGGNLSEILTSIAGTIKERMRIKGEIASITAQGRMSGLIIGALPIGVACILLVAASDYMSTFFTTTAGKIMLVVAAIMEVIGFFAIRKVVTVEY